MEINSLAELKAFIQDNSKTFLLLYKAGTEQSDCARERIAAIEKEGKYPLLYANVAQVSDIHPVYGITSAPSLVEFTNSNLTNIYKGCQSETFYKTALTGSGFTEIKNSDGKPAKRVTVYTTPSCTWCNTIKTYLKEKKVHFLEVDVASNHAKAQEMVKKSGQQGVPQTDINGQIVVGFDKKRINELLEIR